MQIEKVDIDKLRPFEGNPKRHPKEQLDKIVRSFSEFGWTNPFLVTRDNMIIAGHARVEAARKAGIKQVPVIYLPFDGKKAMAYAVADNKLAELAEWDFTKMADLMTELDDGDFDLELTGFDMSEIEEIMNWTPKEEEPFDAAAEADKIKEPKSKRGEIYRLGRHRLGCLDATDKNDVAKLMNGERADICITDPPYNVGMEGYEDNKEFEEYQKFSQLWYKIARMNTDVLLFTPGTGKRLVNYMLWLNIEIPTWILFWVKTNSMIHSPIGGFQAQEPLFLYGKPKKRIPQDVYICPITVQKDVEENGKKLHPTPKQVKLWKMILEDFTDKGNVIFDPFGGSGTTLIACEQLNRRCFMMEISEIYTDVIIKRFEQFSGEKAELIKQ